MSLFDFSSLGKTDTSGTSGQLFDFSALGQTTAPKKTTYVGPYAANEYSPNVTSAVESLKPTLFSKIADVVKKVIPSPVGLNSPLNLPSLFQKKIKVDGISAPAADLSKPALVGRVPDKPFDSLTANILVGNLNKRGNDLLDQRKKVDPSDPDAVDKYNADLDQYEKEADDLEKKLGQFNMTQNFERSTSTPSGEGSLGLTSEQTAERAINLALIAAGVFSGIGALAEAPVLGPMLLKGLTQGAIGVGTFEALDKATQGLKQNASDSEKFMIYLGELFAAGGALHAINEAVPAIGDKLFQTYSEQFNAPKTVYLDGAKVKDIFQTGKLTTADEQKAFSQVTGSDRQKIKDAIRNGVIVELPATTIKNVAETPLWSKLKKAFGIKPGNSTDTITYGKAKAAPQEHNLLSAPTAEDIKNIADQVRNKTSALPEELRAEIKNTGKNFRLKAQALEGSSTSSPSSSISSPLESGRGISLPSLSSKTEKAPLPSSDSSRYVEPINLKNRDDIHEYITNSIKNSQAAEKPFIDNIKKATGYVPEVRIKSPESLGGKIERLTKIYGKSHTEISDVLAGRLVVPTTEIDAAIADIRDNFEVTQLSDLRKKPSKYGYYGVNMQVKLPNGQKAEIQVHSPYSLAHSNETHTLYEKYRNTPESRLMDTERAERDKDMEGARTLATSLRLEEGGVDLANKVTDNGAYANRKLDITRGPDGRFRKTGERAQHETRTGTASMARRSNGDYVEEARRFSEDQGASGESAEQVARHARAVIAEARTPITTDTPTVLKAWGFPDALIRKFQDFHAKGAVKNIHVEYTDEYVSAYDKANDTVYLNLSEKTHMSYRDGSVIEHELGGHSWYTKLDQKNKTEIYRQLQENKDLIKNAWDYTDNPWNNYWEDTINNIRQSLTAASTPDAADTILKFIGLSFDPKITLDNFINRSLGLHRTIDAINRELGSRGYEPMALKAENTSSIEEHVSMLAEKAQELVASNEGMLGSYLDDVRSGTLKYGPDASRNLIYQGETNLSTAILEKLKGRSIVSKQFIEDLTNSGDLKQVERDLIRDVLAQYPSTSADPLAAEARKYKSAEEFVKAQPKVFHGTSNILTEFKPLNPKKPESLIFTTNKGTASAFGKNLNEVSVDFKKPFIFDAKGEKMATARIREIIKQNDINPADNIYSPYDGLIIKNIKGYEREDWLVPFKNESIKTKSQLTDIYNKATAPDTTKIPVADFAEKVKAELLPLKVRNTLHMDSDADIEDWEGPENMRPEPGTDFQGQDSARYESISLPDDVRGNVADYAEHVYESPVKTSAGKTHFPGVSENYFGHTRVEDMAPSDSDIAKVNHIEEARRKNHRMEGEKQIGRRNPEDTLRINKELTDTKQRIEDGGKTRRVIEVQSDLYQKGNLEDELGEFEGFKQGESSRDNYTKRAEARAKEVAKLQQYNDPTAHFRMIREEVKQAALDGKTKMQFPTGETTMKIEGLGQEDIWFVGEGQGIGNDMPLTENNLKIGANIGRDGDDWIVTDILGDGKFKAVPSDIVNFSTLNKGTKKEKEAMFSAFNNSGNAETFDVSGNIDTTSPIYKFYEKEVGRYLKNRYGAERVTDAQGVSWYQVDIQPDMATQPVLAFREGTKDINQLLRMLEREEESLRQAEENPEAFAKAYGDERKGQIEARITELRNRVAEASKEPEFDKEAFKQHLSDVGITPVKVQIANKDVPLPPDLQARQEAIQGSPFNELEKYLVQSGEFKGRLPEVLGKADLSDTPYSRIKNEDVRRFVKEGDKIIQEVFGSGESYASAPDTEEIRDRMDAFISEKEEFIADKKEFIQNYKDDLAIERLARQGSMPLHQRLDELEPPTVRGGLQAPRLNWSAWKDKIGARLSRETMDRNLENVAPPEDAAAVKKFLTDHIRKNEENMVIKANKDKLRVRDLAKKYGIKLRSKLDYLAQAWGEGKIDEEILGKEAGKKADDVKNFVAGLKEIYDPALDFWNDKRKAYDYGPVPRVKNYMRRAGDISFFTKTYGFLKSPQDLPTSLAGVSDFFKPGKAFTTAELHRSGDKGLFSSIQAMNNYIDSVYYQAFHIDSIQRAKALDKYLNAAAEVSEGSPDASPIELQNFRNNLIEYTYTDLARKLDSLDRAVERKLGRPVIRFMSGLANLIGKNIIVGNVSAGISHLVTLPLNFATVKKVPLMKGLMKILISPITKGEFAIIDGVRSSYLTRRFPIKHIMNTNWQKAENAGKVVMWIADSFKTKLAVTSKYYEELGKGLYTKEEAMRLADEYAARLIGDNSTGQVPSMFKSKTLQMFTQFERGLNDSISVLVHDIPRRKGGMGGKSRKSVVWQLMQFAIYSFIFNEVVKKIRGSGRGIDPIGLGLTLAGWNDEGQGQSFPSRLATAGKDLAGELPFTSFFTGNFPVTEALPHFGQLATGQTTWAKEAERLIADLASPIGGGLQAKKSIEGLLAYVRGYAVNNKGVPTSSISPTAANAARTFIFGPTGTPESQDYFNKANEGKAYQAVHTSVSTAKTKLDKLDDDVRKPAEDAWKQAKEALASGDQSKIQSATDAVDALSNPQYMAYKYAVAADADYQETLAKKVTPIVEKVNSLGDTPEAHQLVDNLTDEEYAIYGKIHNTLYGTDTGADIVGDGTESSGVSTSEKVWNSESLIKKIKTVANALGTDPKTVFEDVFAGNSSWRIAGVKNGQIIVVRAPTATTQGIKKAQGALGDNFKLDHTVPLEVGGTNADSNLSVLSTETWKINTPVEDFLGAALERGSITGKEAREYIIRFKAGRSESLSKEIQKEYEEKYKGQPLTFDEIKDIVK